MVIKPEGHGFNSHPGQSSPVSLCGPNFISSANVHMVYGNKISTSYYTLSLKLLESSEPFSLRSAVPCPQFGMILSFVSLFKC